MKLFLVGIILIFLATFCVAQDTRSNRTSRLYVRRKNRISTTEIPEDSTTAIETTTPAPSIPLTVLDTKSAELKAVRDRKIEELLSPKTKCGVQKVNTTAPWIVVIEHTDPTKKDKRKTVSKGVLIGSRHILTTVSSVHNSHPFWVVSSVRLGDTSTWITESSQGTHLNYTRVEIDQVFQHSSKDIAIIKLAEDVEFNDFIQPVCLPIDDNYNFREMYFHLCKRDKERKLDVRILTSMPLTPQDCEILYNRKGAKFETTEFCAWDEFGDSCMGDVGGPLLANFNGRYIVIGLNSYVFTPEDFEADDYPGVYVKVGAFLRWIKSVLAL